MTMTYEEFKEKYNIRYDTLTSSTWRLGGDQRDCWGNGGSISPEPQPSSFDEFDELMERICPNINFIQYKNIFNRCVNSDTESEGDWYGGTAYYGFYKCDMRDLYEALDERNLLD